MNTEAILNEMKQINYESNLRFSKLNDKIYFLNKYFEQMTKKKPVEIMPHFEKKTLKELEFIKRNLCSSSGLEHIDNLKHYIEHINEKNYRHMDIRVHIDGY